MIVTARTPPVHYKGIRQQLRIAQIFSKVSTIVVSTETMPPSGTTPTNEPDVPRNITSNHTAISQENSIYYIIAGILILTLLISLLLSIVIIRTIYSHLILQTDRRSHYSTPSQTYRTRNSKDLDQLKEDSTMAPEPPPFPATWC
ncbi:hypothetical protein J6590_095668 [Homalodisca vitripennis]|nr:hypothetical protein J6590_095668 [Homalodisca vitripennis]